MRTRWVLKAWWMGKLYARFKSLEGDGVIEGRGVHRQGVHQEYQAGQADLQTVFGLSWCCILSSSFCSDHLREFSKCKKNLTSWELGSTGINFKFYKSWRLERIKLELLIQHLPVSVRSSENRHSPSGMIMSNLTTPLHIQCRLCWILAKILLWAFEKWLNYTLTCDFCNK